jgi:DNA-binding GntR family transcriptional regulator
MGTGGDDAIHAAISGAIVEHRLRPGARLREDRLAEVFGVSRTIIRKALQRLALEELVTLAPRRGARVARPTPEEAREVFQARRLIECPLMPDVAARLTDASHAMLLELALEERQALRAREQAQAIRLSSRFHEQLALIAGNRTLAGFVGRLCSRSSLILAVYGTPGHLGCECRDHEQLLAHLHAGNGERARGFMDRHLRAIEASLSMVEDDDSTPDLHRIFAT